MFYNDTRKQIKELARKIMLGNRRRNVFVILSLIHISQPIADVISTIITAFMALHLHKELAETEAKLISEKQEF